MKVTKLSRQILVVFIAVIILTLGISGWMVITLAQDIIADNIIQNHHKLAHYIAEEIDLKITSIYPVLTLLAESDNARSMDQSRIAPELRRYYARFPAISKAYVADLDGRQVVRTDGRPLENVATILGFQVALAGHTLDSDVYLPGEGQGPLVTVYMPIVDNRQVIGVLVVDINFAWLQALLEDLALVHDETAVVFARNGRVVAHSRLAEINGSPPALTDQPLIETLVGETSGVLEGYTDELDRAVMGVHAPVSRLGWGVVIQTPVEELSAEVDTLRRAMGPGLLGGALLAVVAGWLMAFRLAGPLGQLARATEQVAAGDLTATVKVRTSNEVGLLAVSFNKMISALKTSRDETERLYAEVQALNVDLEQRVAERTADLTSANEQLRQEISERKRAEESLRESEERFRVTFEQAAVGMSQVAPEGRWLRVNQKLCDIVGYTRRELLEKTFQEITHPDDLETNLEYVRQALAGEVKTFSLEKRYVRGDGSSIWVDLTASLVREPAGTPKYFIVVIEDITRRKMAEEQLLHDAFHDALTGLPNRALFLDRLARSLGHAKRSRGYLCAVLFLDLDRFKIINDSLGPVVGDQLLIAIAHRLKTRVRSGDTVAHLNGDEFVILFGDTKDAAEVARLAAQIQKVVALPLNLNTQSEEGQEMVITTSIGIALSRDASTGRLYDRAEDVLRDAGIARCRAKAGGRGRVEMFDIGMRAQAVAVLALETGLRRAIKQREFRVYYQPIVSLGTGQITGIEALLRWQRPQRGLICPGEFVPLLEETGLIVPVSEWALRTACAQVKAWHAAGYDPLRVAVNISVCLFQERNLPELVKKILAETGLAASALELEVTESIAMHNVDFNLLLVDELSRMGLHMSIDDFGTGYSSLDRLKRLPINTLKIDRSFVKDLANDPHDKAIITATIAMAHSLQLKVVAEGVETEEQLAFLQAQQCDEVQGYLLGRPMPVEALTKLLQKGMQRILFKR